MKPKINYGFLFDERSDLTKEEAIGSVDIALRKEGKILKRSTLAKRYAEWTKSVKEKQGEEEPKGRLIKKGQRGKSKDKPDSKSMVDAKVKSEDKLMVGDEGKPKDLPKDKLLYKKEVIPKSLPEDKPSSKEEVIPKDLPEDKLVFEGDKLLSNPRGKLLLNKDLDIIDTRDLKEADIDVVNDIKAFRGKYDKDKLKDKSVGKFAFPAAWLTEKEVVTLKQIAEERMRFSKDLEGVIIKTPKMDDGKTRSFNIGNDLYDQFQKAIKANNINARLAIHEAIKLYLDYLEVKKAGPA